MTTTTTKRPKPPVKPKSVVLIDMPEKLKVSTRRLGRPCPHCSRPLTYRKAIDKSNAWYKCEGWTDPNSGQRYAGCEMTAKLKKLDPDEMIALIDARRLDELREYLVAINPKVTADALQQAAAQLRAKLSLAEPQGVSRGLDEADGVAEVGQGSDDADEPPVVIDGDEYQPLPKKTKPKK